MTTPPSRAWSRGVALVLAFVVALTAGMRATPALAAGMPTTGAPGPRLSAPGIGLPGRLAGPFAQRVTISTTPVDVVPGGQGTATLQVGATDGDVAGLTVTVPLAALPAGMSVAAIDAPAGATCTRTAGQARCAGLAVIDRTTTSLSLIVAATPDATPGTSWTAAGITVAGAVPADRLLARVGAAGYTLSATVAPPSGSLEPGGLSSLDVTADNIGPSDATGAHLGIVAPAGTTLQTPATATATACTLTGPTHASCTFDLTAAATPVTFSVPMRVDRTAVAGGSLTGGCVDLDGSGCAVTGGGGDQPIAPITVATPLRAGCVDAACIMPPDFLVPGIRLAVPFSGILQPATTPATVPPGRIGAGVPRITSILGRSP